jgi:hypothetical protein
MTVYFNSHNFTVRRLRPYGAAIQNYSATFTAYSGDFQPITGARVNEVNGRIGRSYEAWVDVDIDIKEGDQVDASGVRYSVKAVSVFEGAGLLDHKHLILERQN